jgi:hypothetical protein
VPDDLLAKALAAQFFLRYDVFDDPVGRGTACHVGNNIQIACRLDIGIVVFKQKKMQAFGPAYLVKYRPILAMLRFKVVVMELCMKFT